MLPNSFELFRRLGLFLKPGFLGAAECSRLCEAVLRAPGGPAEIDRNEIDGRVRRAREVTPEPEIASRMHARLQALVPELDRHFGIGVSSAEPPSFLLYASGAFYRAHRDRSASADGFGATRRISVVLFLNSEADGSAFFNAGYEGGALVFYGLIDDPATRDIGLPLHGDAGLLVAFRAETLHEVKPVVAGTRVTVVTWYS